MIAQTVKLPWYLLRAVVAADDTLLSAFDYSDWPSSNTVSLASARLQDVGGIIISGYGSAAADKDVRYNLYGRRKMGGPVTLLLTGIMTLGTQVCAKDPISRATLTNYKWVDSITTDGGIFDGEAVVWDHGNNRQAILQVDAYGWYELFFEIDLDGGSAAATTFGSILSGVN